MELLHQRPKRDAILSTCHPSAAVEAYSHSVQTSDDEPAAASDLPAPDLVEYVRFMANQRCIQQQQQQQQMRQQKTEDATVGPAPDTVAPPHRIVMEPSAAVAVAILVEELAREFMLSWASRQQGADKNNRDGDCGGGSGGFGVGALQKPSKRLVRVAANLQLAGALPILTRTTVAPDDDETNERMLHALRNRLEVRVRGYDTAMLLYIALYPRQQHL
jgi:hypothetical protein